MARTPLLRSLLRLAADHRRAQARGLPVEAVREADGRAREARWVSRREFLAGAATLAAAAALPRGMSWAAGTSPVRVAIVGGGMAGLAAAVALTDAGFAPTLYEASGRFGGRMKSESAGRPGCAACHGGQEARGDTWVDGQVTDLFGEFIDSGHETMQALAKRFGLPLVDLLAAEPAGATETYLFHGARYPKAEADRDYAVIAKALARDVAAAEETSWDAMSPAGKALDRMSVHQWIETRVPDGHRSRLGALLDAAYAIEFGADTTEQSALNLVALLGYNPSEKELNVFGESDERYRIAGGAEALPRAMVAHLQSRCTLEPGYELSRLFRRSDGASILSFAGKGDVVADHVVLAIPFAVLRGVDLSRAGFDERKLTAIRELGYGHNGKLQLQFTGRHWNGPGEWGVSAGGSYADTGYQATWEATRGQAGASGILVNYTGGSAADAQAIRHPYATLPDPGVAADAQRFLSQIEPVFPGLSAKWNGRAAGTMAHLDRFWGGSYSYYRVGQYQRFGGHEPARQGNVLFAGEHTTQEAQGYMEGAALTGTEAGRRLAAALRKAKRRPASAPAPQR
jgi:monoamine oxidase